MKTIALSIVAALAIPLVGTADHQEKKLTPQIIRTMVEYKLIQDKISKDDRIKIDVEDGIVTLTGTVENMAQMRRAEKVAYGVSGVHSVKNGLKVDMRGDMPDQKIADAVASAIRGSVWFDIFDWVEGNVKEGKVTLRGAVREPWRRGEYERLAEGLSGVAHVDNQIVALPLSPFDDQLRIAIAQNIYGSPQFTRYANRSLPPIHILVENGKVTLNGAVNSQLEKQLAGIIANQSQAFAVDNQLVVDEKLSRPPKGD